MLVLFLSTWFSEHTSHRWGLLQWAPSPPALPADTQRVLLSLLEGDTDRVGELLPLRKAAPERALLSGSWAFLCELEQVASTMNGRELCPRQDFTTAICCFLCIQGPAAYTEPLKACLSS